jgi:hypothetical protein
MLNARETKGAISSSHKHVNPVGSKRIGMRLILLILQHWILYGYVYRKRLRADAE